MKDSCNLSIYRLPCVHASAVEKAEICWGSKKTTTKKQKATEEDEEERQEVAVGLAVAKEISLDAALVAATITIGYQFHIKRGTQRLFTGEWTFALHSIVALTRTLFAVSLLCIAASQQAVMRLSARRS